MAANVPTPALLAGGPEDLYRELRPKLLQRKNIDLVNHWCPDATRTFPEKVPIGTKLVVILTDYIGHPMENASVQAAKAANVPFVRTTRKWSFMAAALATVGFPNVAPPAEFGPGTVEVPEDETAEKEVSLEKFWQPDVEEAAPEHISEPLKDDSVPDRKDPPMANAPRETTVFTSNEEIREEIKKAAKRIQDLLRLGNGNGIVAVTIDSQKIRVTVVHPTEEEL